MNTIDRKHRGRLSGVASLLVLVVLVACEGATGPDENGPPTVVTVVVGPENLVLTVGADRPLEVTLRGPKGEIIAGRPVSWSSSDESVAIVSATGQVRAIGSGTAIVSATADGRWGHSTVQVEAIPDPVHSVAIEPDGEIALVVGGGIVLRAIALTADGGEVLGIPVAWSSEDASVTTVSQAGLVSAIGEGRTRVTAVMAGRSATAKVRVSLPPEPYPFDLLYDTRTGTGNEPEIFRLDLTAPDRPATRILDLSRVWDVSPSPDGTRIAFTCADMYGPLICVANSDGSGARALTSSGGHADQPAWSPDGTRIAYRGWAPGASPGFFNPTHIWVMNADGSNRTNLTGTSPAGTWQESPTWSPLQADGRHRIAFSHQQMTGGYRVGRIASVRDDGADWHHVTSGGGYLESEPSWSPNGQTIVFVRTGGTASGDLWLVDGGGGNERPLFAADPTDDQRSPAWSPDGQLIAFTSMHEMSEGNSWRYQVYTVRADGSEMVRRTATGMDKQNPAWIR